MNREISTEYLQQLKRELVFIEEMIEYYSEIKTRTPIKGFTAPEHESLKVFSDVECYYQDRVNEIKSEIYFLESYFKG